MFICETCIEEFEGTAIETAKFFLIDCGRGSYGPCEFCRKYGMCADVPSSASWTKKGKSD